MNDFDYKSLYNDIEPSPWAVGRLQSRMESMQTDPFDDIWSVFRRRIAAGLVAALVLVAVMRIQNREMDDVYASEWNDYLGTTGVEQLAADLPDYTQTLE